MVLKLDKRIHCTNNMKCAILVVMIMIASHGNITPAIMPWQHGMLVFIAFTACYRHFHRMPGWTLVLCHPAELLQRECSPVQISTEVLVVGSALIESTALLNSSEVIIPGDISLFPLNNPWFFRIHHSHHWIGQCIDAWCRRSNVTASLDTCISHSFPHMLVGSVHWTRLES